MVDIDLLGEDTSVAEIDKKIEDLNISSAQLDLLHFLPYVKIPDPPPLGKGFAEFEQWPHILRLHKAVEAVPSGGVLPNLKARKLGVTSYFEARFLWTAMYQRGAFCVIISQGQLEANKIIQDCRFIWQYLPDGLRPNLTVDNVTTMQFEGGGTLQAFPASSKAGRGYTATSVMMDECDFHDEFESSYNALLPLIQDSGGKMFLVSTANPDVLDSPFRQLYQRSDDSLFLGYYDRPNRTQNTYDSALDLATDIARFEKENPLNEQQALAPPRTRAFFDVDCLEEMGGDVMEPRSHLRGAISVWQQPVVAGRYVIGADTAWGKTGSYNVATVMDWQTGVQVAELHGRLHPEDMAQEIVLLHEMYNHAYMGLERAGEGQERDGDSVVVVDKVVELLRGCACFNKLYYHDHESTRPETPGWQTDGRSRPVMLAELAEAVRNRLIVIRSKGGVGEMVSFIRNEQGRPQAAKGAHDDRVMAYALAWQMRKFAHFPQARNKKTSIPSVF